MTHLDNALRHLKEKAQVPCSSDPGDVRDWQEATELLKYIKELQEKAAMYDGLYK